MEEKKNNAVEKVENIVNQNQVDMQNQNIANPGAVETAPIMAQNIQAQRVVERNKRKEERARKIAQRERQLEQRRVQLARIRNERKAEKQKLKVAAMREKNRKKAELEMRRQELESQRKAQIMANKRAKQENRRRDRQRNKDRNKGYGGWLAAVISLGIATLVLSSVLTFTFLMPSTEDNMLEAAYHKSFYDTVEQVDNIDLNLSKALATADSGALQRYLVDTAINSELAENDIQQLPLQDESKHYTTKLINQIGDFTKYLNNKIINGESLSKADYAALNGLYQANRTLKESLNKMMTTMGNDYAFSAMIDGGKSDMIIEGFSELQNLSVQYPELIYDGPFSDGLMNREIKGLKGAEVDQAYAREQFAKIFAEYNPKDIKSVGETTANIECFNVEGTINGDVALAQFSKKGGELVMFSYAGSCNEVRCDREQATLVAEKFLTDLGVNDMKPVWINLSNNLYTINFAYEKGGVIVYSDLIKVRVCAETEMVIGFETSTYYTNHTDRVIDKPTLSEKQAKSKISENISVDSVRLAVVPIGTKSEKLCYEIAGEYDGSTYYVYIDAITGRQVEMFKVIESTEGTLLM
jgi:germination protein YpeB